MVLKLAIRCRTNLTNLMAGWNRSNSTQQKSSILDLCQHKRVTKKYVWWVKTVEHLCSQESHLSEWKNVSQVTLVNYLKENSLHFPIVRNVQHRKWSPIANDPWTENDSPIGPHMIPNPNDPWSRPQMIICGIIYGPIWGSFPVWG